MSYHYTHIRMVIKTKQTEYNKHRWGSRNSLCMAGGKIKILIEWVIVDHSMGRTFRLSALRPRKMVWNSSVGDHLHVAMSSDHSITLQICDILGALLFALLDPNNGWGLQCTITMYVWAPQLKCAPPGEHTHPEKARTMAKMCNT